MKKTVFISSTFDDLRPHRSKLWDSLQNYDLNIRGMERFGARTECPLTTCITECELSNIYIGILGMRYGSIDESSGKSYTFLEYEAANEKGKDILFFVIDENDARIPPAFVDTGKQRERLDEFKKLAKERHTVATFVDENDLCKKVELSLNQLATRKAGLSGEDQLDDDKRSLELINDFLLMPKAYSGQPVDLFLKINGDPFPASKAICDRFNLEYGKTVGISIEISKPAIERFTNYLFIPHEKYSKAILVRDKSIKVRAVLKFSDDVIDTFRARFIREEFKRYYIEGFGKSLVTSAASVLAGLKEEKVVYEPEGTIILLLYDVIKEE